MHLGQRDRSLHVGRQLPGQPHGEGQPGPGQPLAVLALEPLPSNPLIFGFLFQHRDVRNLTQFMPIPQPVERHVDHGHLLVVTGEFQVGQEHVEETLQDVDTPLLTGLVEQQSPA